MKHFLNELYDLLISTRSKKDSPSKSHKLNQPAKPKTDEKHDVNEYGNHEHFFKKEKESVFKNIEEKLFAAYRNFGDPFWTNLFLIENSKDYSYNKYYTLACLISKSFEKWVTLPMNTHFVSNYILTNELKISAFIIACKHHLLMIDSIFKAYSLNKDNAFLLPYVKVKSKFLDHKDKAVLISSSMMHDFFDFEEVKLVLSSFFLIKRLIVFLK